MFYSSDLATRRNWLPLDARRHEQRERASVHLRLVTADTSALAFDRDQLLESGDRSVFWSIRAFLRHQLPTVAAERSRPGPTFRCSQQSEVRESEVTLTSTRPSGDDFPCSLYQHKTLSLCSTTNSVLHLLEKKPSANTNDALPQAAS